MFYITHYIVQYFPRFVNIFIKDKDCEKVVIFIPIFLAKLCYFFNTVAVKPLFFIMPLLKPAMLRPGRFVQTIVYIRYFRSKQIKNSAQRCRRAELKQYKLITNFATYGRNKAIKRCTPLIVILKYTAVTDCTYKCFAYFKL